MSIQPGYVIYHVFFTNIDDYNFAISLSNENNYVLATPVAMAALLGLTYPPVGDPTKDASGIYYDPGHAPGDNFPQVPGGPHGPITLDDNQDPGEYDNWPGNPDVGASGEPIYFYWCAEFDYIPNNAYTVTNNPPTDQAPMPYRRWIMGFELGGGGATEGQSGNIIYSRDSSRTVEGVGFALRNVSNTYITQSTSKFYSVSSNQSWERIYARVRTFGTGNFDFWHCGSSISSNAGGLLYIGTDGSLKVFNNSDFGVQNQIGTVGGVFTLNTWVKIDILVFYNNLITGGGNGYLGIYINGVNKGTFAVDHSLGGLGDYGAKHSISYLGTQSASSNNLWEVDLDDWMNADYPEYMGNPSFTSFDWMAGTHILGVKSDSGTLSGFAGNFQYVNQIVAPNLSLTPLTSSTASSTIAVVTNAVDPTLDFIASQELGNANGVVANAVLVSAYTKLASGTTSGQLGYSLSGGAATLSAISESSTAGWKNVFYKGDNIDILPSTITPLGLNYVKAATTTQASVYMLAAEVEYTGTWGLEDSPNSTAVPKGYIHNAWFPQVVRAYSTPLTEAQVFAVGGIYTGNGTVQTTSLPAPVHFLWIIPNTAAAGCKFFGASLGAHVDTQDQMSSDQGILRLDYDSDTQLASFTVIGNNSDSNASGTTYQYIAFCDPGYRFNLCGAFKHDASATGIVNSLIEDSEFQAKAAFAFPETYLSSASTTLKYVGPGFTQPAGTYSAGGLLTDFLNLNLGTITSGADANASAQQVNYSLWRPYDSCGFQTLQIFAYTGTGTSSLTVPCTPTSLRYPLFVYVQPHNAVGWTYTAGAGCRQVVTGSSTATGVTAVGIDTITVGTTLNGSGIIYDVFIILGDDTSFTNGTYYPPLCLTGGPGPSGIVGINLLSVGGLLLGGAGAFTILKNISGLYTLQHAYTHDTMNNGTDATIDLAIPNPRFRTGFIRG